MILDYFDARIRCKKIPIKPCKSGLDIGIVEHVIWTKSPAFAVNPRGVLIHRVKHVCTIFYGTTEHHHHVAYLCGNGCNVDLEKIVDTLVADPPEDRLLCCFCESHAERKKLPSGDALAGRHVHRGVLVAKQVCCQTGES